MPFSAWESPRKNLGDIRGAITAYAGATALLPSLTEAWFRSGALVHTFGTSRTRRSSGFRRASATGGNTSFGRLGKARALLTEDRDEEAELVLRKTLARDPGERMRTICWQSALGCGVLTRLANCFQRAIAIAPLLAGSYYDAGALPPRHE